MDATQINEVVDKLAEKIGVAADALKPIALETVRQVQLRGLVFAGITVLCTVVMVASLLRLTRQAVAIPLRDTGYDPNGGRTAAIVATTAGVLVATLIGFIVTAVFLGQYIAPIPYLLGK